MLDQVLTATVKASGKVSALDLFLQLRELQGPLDDLLCDLCEHSYRVLAGDFLMLCTNRELPPEPLRFHAWLTMSTELPGYLVTVFSERLEQDQLDGSALPLLNPEVCDRLAKLEAEFQESLVITGTITEVAVGPVAVGPVAVGPAAVPEDTFVAPKDEVTGVTLLTPGDAEVAAMIEANMLVPLPPDE